MTWTMLDTWIVVAGVLCAMSCALLGNFLVLRKMSLMGDAISHAVLPGLAVAFLLTGSRSSIPMFVGAAVVGVLTAVFTEWVRGFGKVEEGASMGVVFTALFAIGLILIVQAADRVDLDPGCVLYGAIEMTPIDLVGVMGRFVPRAVVVLSIVFAINALFVLVFYKELKISSFDPGLATTVGINAKLMHYLLMTLVAITTVASFEAVGSILVVAMLVVPGATAYLLTDRLGTMLVLSLVIGAVSAVIGHVAAVIVPGWFGFSDTSTAGMMAATAGLLFALVMLVAPRHGIVSRLAHQAALRLRIAREDILGLLYRQEEVGGRSATATIDFHRLGIVTGTGPIMGRLALLDLRRRGDVVARDSGYHVTDKGRSHARDLVRSHRLWECYLHESLGVGVDHVHASADRVEHFTAPAMREEIVSSLNEPGRDPHGEEIPRE
ncbi:MAG TPA: metal ABC transporter permease [Phycisphaerae bacterium]|nr:metal ABC transporter permease [Phycisphaerae bacterium]HOJ73586.1 metal ABC transporter permease [Phycisphaerae bacterium]HOM51605.1 metal ABC transporter permease [Phycisphaerae bacterium]HON65056.1 metal ABC transporter permease [Phycisphaerae bacterium]HPP25577.1 metal ABC transporter permease [Phycisphaerae bacterium]